jgi:hypothetical protein
MYVRAHAHTLDRFSVNKDVGEFYEKSLIHFIFHLDWMNFMTTLCEDIHTFCRYLERNSHSASNLSISRLIFIVVKNALNKSYSGKLNTHV